MKKYLLTGLAVLLPLVLTIKVIFFFIALFTSPFVHLIERHVFGAASLPDWIILFISRLLALLLLCTFVFLLGIVARWFAIKNVLSFTTRLLSRIPFIKTIYKISRDVINALFSTDGKKAFKYPVIFPFPHPPTYAMGFQAGEVAAEIQEKIKEPLLSVFAPTAPHPITGFLLLILEKDVCKIDLTNEQAVKYLVSCGILHEHQSEEK